MISHNTTLCRSSHKHTLRLIINSTLRMAYKNGFPIPTRLSPTSAAISPTGITMAQSHNATAEAMAAAAKALLLGPGLQPPPGVTPNFIDPPSQTHWVYITLPICLAVSTPFVWIRLYTVFFILKSHGWADCVYKYRTIRRTWESLRHSRYLRRRVGFPRRICHLRLRCRSVRRWSPSMGRTTRTCHRICKSIVTLLACLLHHAQYEDQLNPF